VILRGFHSLTLNGTAKQLNVSAFDSAELVAADFSVEKAFVSIDKYAKIELNASNLVQGKKFESSKFSNKSSNGVNYKWSIVK
jgi:hypothetical protein